MITLKKNLRIFQTLFSIKTVIVRVDLNLPFYEDNVSDLTRVEKIFPTIEYLLKNKAKIILISHFGRPKGEKKREMSLIQILDDIRKVFKREIQFCDDSLKTVKKEKIENFLKNVI